MGPSLIKRVERSSGISLIVFRISCSSSGDNSYNPLITNNNQPAVLFQRSLGIAPKAPIAEGGP
jgi:hypothetical protein